MINICQYIYNSNEKTPSFIHKKHKKAKKKTKRVTS